MTPRTVGFFVATAIATRLLGGGTVGDVSQEPVTTPQPRVDAPRGAVPQPVPEISFAYTDRLRERIKQTAIPERGRNPFVYGSRHVVSAPTSAPEPVAAAPVPVEPPFPVIKLSGIAGTQQDGTLVLTAIVIDNGVMVFAKAGDRLSSGYTVTNIDETAVTLTDAAGVTMTLRLP